MQDCHKAACRQLEVLKNNDDGGERGSLLWLMDHTKTPFGGRLLRNWVAHPLTDRRRINERLDAVEEMVAAGSAVEQSGRSQAPHAVPPASNSDLVFNMHCQAGYPALYRTNQNSSLAC